MKTPPCALSDPANLWEGGRQALARAFRGSQHREKQRAPPPLVKARLHREASAGGPRAGPSQTWQAVSSATGSTVIYMNRETRRTRARVNTNQRGMCHFQLRWQRLLDGTAHGNPSLPTRLAEFS